ncbi:type IV secretion system protein [Polaromonas sp. JS666]|uniref:type IV secretion system protein n=1 Tax=Polaromonas sp. (strain JS666 / ATCC BAA-500) TaxID=296591 RepID=UPI0000D5B498|nr:type IV secretion system protein [Polaromonas sp. JS666]ABE47092.1 TrbL/VirB6 plasmid conjugal transfer protein [Polaromonas sp. JS666]
MYTVTSEDTGRRIFADAVGGLMRVARRFLSNAIATAKAQKVTFGAIIFVLMMSSLMAVAQNNTAGTPESVVSGPPAVNSIGMNSTDVASMIAKSMDDKLNGLTGSTTLMGARDIILGVGLAIGLFWTGLKTMVAGKGIGELLGEWIPILITAGVVTAFTTPGPGSAGNQIAVTMDQIAGAITGAAGGQAIDTSSVQGVIGSAVTTTFNAVVSVARTPQRTEGGWSNIAGAIASVPIWVFATIMKLVTSFIIVIAMCIYMATAVMAMVSIKLVIALAPVMVPFLIFKPTAWLFDSWLRFLLGASMMKLVGAFMLSLTSGLMSSMVLVAQKIDADSAAGTYDTFTGDIVLFATILLLSVLAGLLMAQVPSISSGLLAGSAGGAGFSGLKGVSQTLGAKAGTSATSAGGRYGYDKGIGEARAARQGAKDAAGGFSTGGRQYGSQRASTAYLRGHAVAKAGAPQAAAAAKKANWRD